MKIDAKAHKPKRSHAFEIVARIKRGEEVHPRDLDNLLCYFAPPQPRIAKNPLEWAAKFSGVTRQREYLGYVFVRDGIARASDGVSACRAFVDVPDGHYKPGILLPVEPDSLDHADAAESFWLNNFDQLFDVAGDDYECKLGSMTRGVSERHKPIWYLKTVSGMCVPEDQLYRALNTTDPAARITCQPGMNRVAGRHEFGEFIVMEVRV